MDNRPRYRVPDELRETLLDFTIAYLLERPPNLIDFGIQFFQRLKNEREQGGSSGGRGSQVNGRSNEIDDDQDRRQHRHRRHSHGSGGGTGGGGSYVASQALQRGRGGATRQGNTEEEREEMMGVTQAATEVVEETVVEARAQVERRRRRSV